MTAFPVHGRTAPAFDRLRDVFARNFTDDIEVGASFCAMRDGALVVDLWGGWQDRAGTRPWQADTLSMSTPPPRASHPSPSRR
jgi:hypothetical protein